MLRWLCLALPVAVGAFAVHARPTRLSLHPEMRPLPPRTANANMGLNLDSRIYLALDSLDKVALRPVVASREHVLCGGGRSLPLPLAPSPATAC